MSVHSLVPGFSNPYYSSVVGLESKQLANLKGVLRPAPLDPADRTKTFKPANVSVVEELNGLRREFRTLENQLREVLKRVYVVDLHLVEDHHPVSEDGKQFKKEVLELLKELQSLADTENNFRLFEKELPNLSLLDDPRIINIFPDEIFVELNAVRQDLVNSDLKDRLQLWFELSSTLKTAVENLVQIQQSEGQEGDIGTLLGRDVRLLCESISPVALIQVKHEHVVTIRIPFLKSSRKIFSKIIDFCKQVIVKIASWLRYLRNRIACQKTASRTFCSQ